MKKPKKKTKTKKAQESRSPIILLHGWWKRKNPILKFVGAMSLLLVVFYVFIHQEFFEQLVHPMIIALNAQLSSWLLNLLGQETQYLGSAIYSSVFTVDIKQGCDALEPVAMTTAAMLAYPCTAIHKMLGVVAAIVFLCSLNLLRIVSLFLCGVYFHSVFDLLHVEIWQFLFIVLAIAFCFFWIDWTLRQKPTDPTQSFIA